MTNASAESWTKAFGRLLVLSAALTGVACAGAEGGSYEDLGSVESALEGGNILSTTNVGKMGFVKFPGTPPGCSGVVLASSSFWNKSYVLTAGHCVPKFVTSPASVIVNGKSVSGVSIPNPAYAGQISNDIALVELPQPVEVLNPSGLVLLEYRRPVYTGDVDALRHLGGILVGGGRLDGQPDEKCDHGNVFQNPHDGSVRFAEFPSISDGDPDILAVPMAQLLPQGSRIHKGDSGGPWLFVDGGPGLPISRYIEDGVVIGTSAKEFCDKLFRDEAQAIRVGDEPNAEYLASVMGRLLVSVNENQIPFSRNSCWEPWSCVYGDLEKAALLVPTALW